MRGAWMPRRGNHVTDTATTLEHPLAGASSASAPAPGAAPQPPELVCPAGSLPALKNAIDGGADCVYLGLRDATNARNFAGLNFDEKAIQELSLIHI